MSDNPPIGHNRPPLTTFAEMLTADQVMALIEAELNREPDNPEGGKIKSIRERDVELQDMCKRFISAHPVITDDEVEGIATGVLSTAIKFPGRIENARKALKQPVWDAGVKIDGEFGKYGTQMEIRPPTGKNSRRAPFTLAEQLNIMIATYKDAKDTRIREEAAAEAKRKAEEAKLAEQSAARGGVGTFGQAAEAAIAAETAEAIATAPTAALTTSRGDGFGLASLRRVRTFRIINPGIVPRHLCVPSDALIREAIGKAGDPIPSVDGIVIDDVPDLNRR